MLFLYLLEKYKLKKKKIDNDMWPKIIKSELALIWRECHFNYKGLHKSKLDNHSVCCTRR